MDVVVTVSVVEMGVILVVRVVWLVCVVTALVVVVENEAGVSLCESLFSVQQMQPMAIIIAKSMQVTIHHFFFVFTVTPPFHHNGSKYSCHRYPFR